MIQPLKVDFDLFQLAGNEWYGSCHRADSDPDHHCRSGAGGLGVDSPDDGPLCEAFCGRRQRIAGIAGHVCDSGAYAIACPG